MSTNHLSSFPLPSESVQSSCPYSLIIASHGLRRQGLRKPLTLFLFLAIIGAPRMDAFPPVFLWPQRVPQTLPGHMVTTGKRGHKTIYIPAESAGNVWKSIQIRAFNSFASERSRVRIPSGPPKINIPRRSRGYLLYGRSPMLPATPHAALVRLAICIGCPPHTGINPSPFLSHIAVILNAYTFPSA